MAPQAFHPTDIDALQSLIASATCPLCFIAGGSDLLVSPRAPPREGWLIDISRTSGLAFIELRETTLRIGATTSVDAIARSPIIATHFSALGQAAELFGSAQIRNRATIGGNLANASPAGDFLPMLKCARASFRVLGKDGGERWLAFDALVVGAGRTSLASGDLIAEIRIPLVGRLTRGAFVKLGRREALTISRLNLTMEADFDEGSLRFGEIQLIAGAIAPTPTPMVRAADTLRGKALSGSAVRAFVEALRDDVDEAILGRESRRYKRRAVMGLGFDLLEKITGVTGLDAFPGALP